MPGVTVVTLIWLQWHWSAHLHVRWLWLKFTTGLWPIFHFSKIRATITRLLDGKIRSDTISVFMISSVAWLLLIPPRILVHIGLWFLIKKIAQKKKLSTNHEITMPCHLHQHRSHQKISENGPPPCPQVWIELTDQVNSPRGNPGAQWVSMFGQSEVTLE